MFGRKQCLCRYERAGEAHVRSVGYANSSNNREESGATGAVHANGRKAHSCSIHVSGWLSGYIAKDSCALGRRGSNPMLPSFVSKR
jgi:hypothetical protein